MYTLVMFFMFMLQAGKFQFPMRSLDFPTELNYDFRGGGGVTQSIRTRNLPEDKGRPERKADVIRAVFEPIF
jgi:hypothetical protein